MAKKQLATLSRKVPELKEGKIVQKAEEFEVEVMAVVSGYAMVRRKGCVPFVESAKHLTIKE